MSFLSKTIPFSVPQQPGQRLQLGNLQAESLALLLSEVAQQQSGVILVVTPDSFTANQLETSLNFFAPELTVLSFPDWETLPYDQFSPHQDIISQRLFYLDTTSLFTARYFTGFYHHTHATHCAVTLYSKYRFIVKMR
nr:hypothetical protein [Rickettsiella massiliensis]